MVKSWSIKEKAPPEILKRFPRYHPLVAQLLYNLGLADPDQAEVFFDPDFSAHVHAAEEFKDMAAALDLAVGHIKKGNKIVVYGDYDADGVTASVLLMETLLTLRADTEVYIPYRVSEGYGLNRPAVEELAGGGVKLIITVDNGIRNRPETEAARQLGLDVIISDHHLPPDEADGLPACPIINPHAPGENYPDKQLAGVGVAFKFAGALISRSTLGESDKKKLTERLLDLVAIGTVADCSCLLGENRVLVKKGLEVLNKLKRPGLRALVRSAGIDRGKPLDAWHIGFQIGPRLNAAGRLEHANSAYQLLITRDEKEAAALADGLSRSNQERQRITEEIVSGIESGLAAADKSGDIIVAASPDISGAGESWNEGVIGLAASRLSEKYYRPVLVLAKSQGEIKGSGRSVPGFNLMAALEALANRLSRFGGHAAACGFTLKDSSRAAYESFVAAVKEEAARRLAGAALDPSLEIDAELDLPEIGEDLVAAVERFSPFGAGNPRPKFLSRGLRVVDLFRMGAQNQHLKLRLQSGHSGVVTAVGFGQGESWPDLSAGKIIDMVYYMEMNEYNGRREAQLKILDIKDAFEN